MKRLTKKIENQYIIECPNLYNYIDGKNQSNEFLSAQNKGVQKLGKLEDIEEKFGIDLDTLSIASENGFYMINEGKIEFVWRGYLFNLRGHYIQLNCGYKQLDFKLENKPFSDILLFEDYGKTWALTREELE